MNELPQTTSPLLTTGGGALREDRLVLSIPPGMHWNEAQPMIYPALNNVEGPLRSAIDGPVLSAIERPETGSFPSAKVGHAIACREIYSMTARNSVPYAKESGPRVRVKKASEPMLVGMQAGGLRWMNADPVLTKKGNHPREEKAKAKIDPRLTAAARELRDWWLEQVNERPMIDGAKYQVGREARPSLKRNVRRLAA